MYTPILFFIFWYLLIPQHLQGQSSSTTDSLKNSAEKSKIPDEKANLYYQLSKQYLGSDFDKAEQYAQLAFQYYTDDNYLKKGDCYGLFTAIYAQTSRVPKALICIDSSIYFYEIIKDTVGLSLAYSSKGAVLILMNQLEGGAQAIYKSLKLNEKAGNITATLSGLHNLLEVYRVLGDFDKMFATCQTILVLADSTNDTKMKAFVYDAMGVTMFNQSKLDSALMYYQKAIPVFQEIKNQEYVALTYCHIGHIYALQKKDTLALLATKQAKALEGFINSQTNRIEFHLNIAHIYYATGNYNQSIILAKRILDSAYSINNLHYQEQALNRLLKNMVKLKKFDLAYQYHVQYKSIMDSALILQKQDELLNLEVKYNTEKIQQENKLLAQEKDFEKLRANRNRLLLYLSVLAILFILVISFLLMRQYKTNAALLTNQLKHRLLRNQMSPHFIFNSLVAIQSFVYKKAPIQAGEYLASFAQLIRAILENSTEEYISLGKEVQWLDNYLKLQLLRFDNSFDYTIDLGENIDLENILIPPMLTQPFIENALEHGLSQLGYRGKIAVKMRLSDDLLHIEVSDNGIGIDASKRNKNDKEHTSLALKITQERLHFLNKKRGKSIFFNIKNLDSKGTLVSFSLPLMYKY
ncbi:MAG: sensor histidine kinase YesM [Aureispira sp.]|jgi:sensor histidine kinase YesM